jgi:aromatic-L-amino-acid decarboxylase
MKSIGTEPAPGESVLRLDAGRDEALASASAVIQQAWRSFDRFRVGQPPVDEKLEALLREALPERGTPTGEAIADAARALDESIAQPRPRYFAFIGSSGLEIGVIADALAACYDVNLAVWAGAASEVELQAVRWAGELVGFDGEAGSFTSGGTISNLTALTAARERAVPELARRPLGPTASACTARRRFTTPSSAPRSCSGSLPASSGAADRRAPRLRRTPSPGRSRPTAPPGSSRWPSSPPPGRR